MGNGWVDRRTKESKKTEGTLSLVDDSVLNEESG